MKSTIVRKLLLASLISPLALQAQSFFFGQPGPGVAQLETRVNQEGQGVTIPKYFDKEHNYLVATPFTFDENGIRNVGLNVGYIAQNLGNENTDAIFATGIFRNSEGKYNTITPQFYLTQTIPISQKYFATIDAEGAVAFDTANNKQEKSRVLSGAVLPGVGNSHSRIGVGIKWQEGEKPQYTLELRKDFGKYHNAWITGSINKEKIVFGLFYNVGIKKN